jgi:hypothetical protein
MMRGKKRTDVDAREGKKGKTFQLLSTTQVSIHKLKNN